jgi:hypothetical protein
MWIDENKLKCNMNESKKEMELERYYDHDLFNKKWTSFYKIWRPIYKFSTMKLFQVFVMSITFTSVVSIVYGHFEFTCYFEWTCHLCG